MTKSRIITDKDSRQENKKIEKLLMNLEEAAEFLNISPATLRLWAWQGKVPCVRLGRRRLFKKDDLIKWVEMHTCPAKPQGRLTRRKPLNNVNSLDARS